MDWSENNSCIKCDKGSNLLVCSENGCPLTIHEGCLGCPARLDDAGRFYCPYCLYKKAVAESHKAREYALARKKALLVFMDGNVIGSEKDIVENKTCEDNAHNQSKTSETNVNNALCDDGKSKSNNDGIIDQPLLLGEEEKISNAGEGSGDSEASAGSKGQDPSLKMNGENGHRTAEEGSGDSEASAGAKDQDPSLEMNGENGNRTAEEERVQEEARATSAEEQIQEEELATSAEEQIQEEERVTPMEEEKIQEEECASTGEDPSLTVGARARRRSKRSKPVDKDSDEAVPVQSKLRKQHGKKKQASLAATPTRRSARTSSPAVKNSKVVIGEFGSPRRLRKSAEPSDRLARATFGSAKRTRRLWTEEEVEALKEGVKMYSKEANVHMPWRKILDSSDKFDKTRNPGDLKDKWRNMTGK